MRYPITVKSIFAASALLSVGCAREAVAAEGGAGFYLLGSTGPAAGALGPSRHLFSERRLHLHGESWRRSRGWPEPNRLL